MKIKKQNLNFHEQGLSADSFNQVLGYLVSSKAISGVLLYQLCRTEKKEIGSLYEPERLEFLYKSLRLSFRLKMRIREAFLKLKN